MTGIDLVVRTVSRKATRGVLLQSRARWPCALGRSGIGARKREGDGATPLGCYRLVAVLYRADRRARPRTGLPVRAIRAADGWCDDVCDRNYNRAVRLPYPGRSEALRRDDGVYDLVVVLSHNSRPRVRGAGSAIFIHVARAGFLPTEGCIALEAEALERIISHAGRGTTITIK